MQKIRQKTFFSENDIFKHINKIFESRQVETTSRAVNEKGRR